MALVTIVNHVGIDITCEPASVWREILDDYAHGRKFRDFGYTIEAIEEDVSAFLGGYRMMFGPDGEDERICSVSELDETAMRLSLCADYLSSGSNGMVVHATYQARSIPTGTRYEIDSYTRFEQQLPAHGGKAAMARLVAELKAQFDLAMADYLFSTKARLEQHQSSKPLH